MTKLTKTQQEILVHLRDGGILNRRDSTCQRVYELLPGKSGRIILAKTVDRMVELKLIYNGIRPGYGQSTYLLTELGHSSI